MGGWIAYILNLLGTPGRRARVIVEASPAAPVELELGAAAALRMGVEAAAPVEITVAPVRVDVTAEVAPP